jgi:divalent metal cation (Fe/Co/Zn/Cd) transporter
VVAITFFLLAIYITWEAVKSLISREEPLTSSCRHHLGGAFAGGYADSRLRQAASRQRDGKPPLIADSKETWVCSYLSLTVLLGLAPTRYSAGGGPIPSVRSQCSRSSSGKDARHSLKREPADHED